MSVTFPTYLFIRVLINNDSSLSVADIERIISKTICEDAFKLSYPDSSVESVFSSN